MNQTTIIGNSRKPDIYPISTNLFPSPALAKIVKKQPTQFATALAHEIRNPLSNITLAADMLKASIMDDEQKLYLDIIIRGAERIDILVFDLLSYYRVDKMQFENHSVHSLLDEVLAMNEDRIMLKNIIVRKDYSIPDCKICGDKQKIKIALTNIVMNAIDAMPPENGELNVVTKSKHGKCAIEIKDNGEGISRDDLKNIFKPYFTKKKAGMGLGLSTTLDILQSNHIGINVESQEGLGTSFILSFNKVQ
jgi:signal transduction histidine kinase